MRALVAGIVLMVGSVLAAPCSALAQGASVHGSIAAAASGGSTAALYGGAVDYRFNRALAFGVELTRTGKLSADFPHILCCGPDEKMRLTTFTTNVRLEIPTTSARIIPFVVGGGGVAAMTQTYHVFYAQPLLSDTLSATLGAMGFSLPINPGPIEVENTTTNLALTLGGGASFLLNRHLSVDADLRLLHITGNDDQNIGRFGAGVSYRF